MTKNSDWIARRATRLLLALVLAVVISVGAYYVWDNYLRSSPSALGSVIEQMEELVGANPSDPELRTALGDVYLASGMYHKAITQYKETLKIVEDHKGALFGLGSAYMALGREGVAIDYLKRVVELSKGSEMARLDKRLEASYYYLGQIYLDRGDLDQAIEQLENAIALNPGDADALFLLGKAQQGKRAYNEAIEYYGQAVTYVPDFIEAYQGMAECCQVLGDESLAAYAEGMVALLSGSYQEAIRQLELAVATECDIANAYWGLGRAYARTGQTEQAKDAYGQALEVDPDYIPAQAALHRLQMTSP